MFRELVYNCHSLDAKLSRLNFDDENIGRHRWWSLGQGGSPLAVVLVRPQGCPVELRMTTGFVDVCKKSVRHPKLSLTV